MMFLSNFFQLLLLTYLGKSYLKFKFPKKVVLTVFLITAFMINAIISKRITCELSVFCFFIYAIYIEILFTNHWDEKTMILIPFCTMFVFSHFLSVSLFVLDKNVNTFSIIFILSQVLCNVVLCILVKAYIQLTDFEQLLSLSQYIYLIYILPVIIILLLFTLAIFYNIDNTNYIFNFIFLVLFISVFLTYYLFVNFIRYNNEKNEMRFLKYREKYSSAKYQLLDLQYKNNFNFLHSMLNQFQNIGILMNNKEYEEAYYHLTSLSENTYKNFNEMYTNSVVLNSVINLRKDILDLSNITIVSTIEYDDLSFIDFCDQIDLFGNLLDIGIRYIKDYDDKRTIYIKSAIVSEKVVIQYKFFIMNEDVNKNEISKMLQPILSKYHTFLSIEKIKDNLISVLIIFKDQNLSKEC